MTVYVDNMRASYGRLIMCRMIADTDEELRAMADKIGVLQKWHQGDHFDISLTKRKLAVEAGAVQVTRRQLASMNMRRRFTEVLGSPIYAEQWVKNYYKRLKVRQ